MAKPQLDTPVGTHKRPIWDAMWDPLGIPSGLPPVFVSGDPPGSRRDNPFGPHGSLEFTTCTPCGTHVDPLSLPHHPPCTPYGSHVDPASSPVYPVWYPCVSLESTHHPPCTPHGSHVDPTSSIYPMWYPRVSLESTTSSPCIPCGSNLFPSNLPHHPLISHSIPMLLESGWGDIGQSGWQCIVLCRWWLRSYRWSITSIAQFL